MILTLAFGLNFTVEKSHLFETFGMLLEGICSSEFLFRVRQLCNTASTRALLTFATSSSHRRVTLVLKAFINQFLQAFVIYEEEISDSREQVWALQLLTGTLLTIECFKEEEHASLRSQCTLGQ